jgi:hypothetical protein
MHIFSYINLYSAVEVELGNILLNLHNKFMDAIIKPH